jgi:hypothetical protein
MLYFGRWPEGEVRDQLYRWGFKVQRCGGLRCLTPKESCAFLFWYTGQFPRGDLDQLKAELVDRSGSATPLQGASESYSLTKNQFARIWVIEPRPTGPTTLRLSLATSGVRVADIRMEAPIGR